MGFNLVGRKSKYSYLLKKFVMKREYVGLQKVKPKIQGTPVWKNRRPDNVINVVWILFLP